MREDNFECCYQQMSAGGLALYTVYHVTVGHQLLRIRPPRSLYSTAHVLLTCLVVCGFCLVRQCIALGEDGHDLCLADNALCCVHLDRTCGHRQSSCSAMMLRGVSTATLRAL
jgi:hypothetical protein